MAEINNMEDIQERFEYITDALDSMRAQNAISAGSFDKTLTEITGKIETLSGEEDVNLIKAFLSEMANSLNERHSFVSSKFEEVEQSFDDIILKTKDQVKASELREVFEVIASNFNNFSQDFVAQRDLISEIGLKLDDIQDDDSQTKEILKNISVLKVDVEKFSNGFESIIIKLNESFNDLSSVLSNLDTKDDLSSIKKGIEDIFLSSNAVLSALQVIDRKNRELEDVITNLVTKNDFEHEREQVADLIEKNVQLTEYVNALPTQVGFIDLSEKVDTAVGVMNALKNILADTGKQNQEMLTAQLDSLEDKILNISTEEEFVGFRKELSEFAQEVIKSTNLMRVDLADTNESLKRFFQFLSSMDMKNTFDNFINLTRNSEENIKKEMVDSTAKLTNEMDSNLDIVKTYANEKTSEINAKIEATKEELKESSKGNLSSVIEHVQSIVNNIFSVKNALQIENAENAEKFDSKLEDLKESVTNSSNFVVQSSQENLETILSNIHQVSQEIDRVKEDIGDNNSKQVENLGDTFNETAKKIEEIKAEIRQTSQDNFANIVSAVEDFSLEISKMKENLTENIGENKEQINSFVDKLASDFEQIQQDLSNTNELNTSELKMSMEELISSVNRIKSELNNNADEGFSDIKSSLVELSGELSSIKSDFELRTQSNFESLIEQFGPLSREFAENKEFFSQTAQQNFEVITSNIQDVVRNISESKYVITDEMKSNVLLLQNAISNIPQLVKENQEVFEDEKRTLIEENSKNISDMSEKVQNLIKGIINKDNPFKGEVLYEFADIKTNLNDLKGQITESKSSVEDSVTEQFVSNIEKMESILNEGEERYRLNLMGMQNRLTEYLDLIQSTTQQSELKIDNSIREIAEIRVDLEPMVESLAILKSDNRLADLAVTVDKKIEGILLSITQMEELSNTRNSDVLRSITSNLEDKFEDLSNTFKEYRNYTTDTTNEFISQIQERLETLKGQLGLINSDILAAINSKTAEVLQGLNPIVESLDALSQINIDTELHEIKNQVNDSASLITAVLKEENISQMERFSDAVENTNFRMEKLFSELSFQNKEGAEDLKLVLETLVQGFDAFSTNVSEKLENNEVFNEKFLNIEQSLSGFKIQNVELLNSAVRTIIDELQEVTASKDSFSQMVEKSKTEVIDKINIFEEALMEAQSEVKTELIGKIQSNVNLIREEFNSAAQVLVSETMDKVVEVYNPEFALKKLESIEYKLIQLQEETKSDIIDKLQEDIYSIKEGLDSSAKELVSEAVERVVDAYNPAASIEKLNIIEEKLEQIQDDAKSEIIKQLQENISSVKESINSSANFLITETMERLSNSADQERIIDQINIIEHQLIKSQGDVKAILLEVIQENINSVKESLQSASLETVDRFLEVTNQEKIYDQIVDIEKKLTDAQEELKSEITFEIQDSIRALKEGVYSSTKSIVAEAVESSIETYNQGAILEKIGLIEHKLYKAQEDIKSVLLEEIRENITSIRENYYLSTKSLVSESIEKATEEAKLDIFKKLEVVEGKIIEAQSEVKSDILEELLQAQDESKLNIIEEIKGKLELVRDDISYSTQEQVSQTVESSLKSSRSEVFQKFDLFEEKLSDLQTDTKETILNELKEGIGSIRESYSISIQSIISDTTDISRERVFEKLAEIEVSLVNSFNNSRSEVVDELKDAQEDSIKALLDDIKSKLESIKEDIVLQLEGRVSDVVASSIKSSKEEMLEKIETLEDRILESQQEIQSEIIGSQETLKNTILDELNDNIVAIKDELDNFAIDDEVTKDLSKKIENLQTVFKSLSADIENNINEATENYSTSTQAMLTDIKASFYERVEDRLDELKSFVEVLEDKRDFSTALSDLRIDILDKFSEFTYNVDESIKESNVKADIQEMNDEIGSLIEDSFKKLEELINASVEESEKLGEVSSNVSDMAQKVEELKKSIADEVSVKLAEFELVFENQKKDSNLSFEEIKEAVSDLKESYVDLSINSSMELSGLLIGIQEKIDKLEHQVAQNAKTELLESNHKELSAELKEIAQKLEKTVQKELIEVNQKQITDELGSINQKLDLLALESDEELESNVKEIKEIIESQNELIKQLDKLEKLEKLEALDKLQKLGNLEGLQNLSKLDKLSTLSKLDELAKLDNLEKLDRLEKLHKLANLDEIKHLATQEKLEEIEELIKKQNNSDSACESISEIKSEVQKALKSFEEKLDELSLDGVSSDISITPSFDSSSIKKELSSFKDDLFSSLVEIFNQISFVVEAEDIKDFIEEKSDELRDDFNSKIKKINRVSAESGQAMPIDSDDIRDYIDEMTEELKKEFNSKLKSFNGSERPLNIDFDSDDIKNFIEEKNQEIKDQLKKFKNDLLEDDSDDYTYTLQDVESDIAKLRLVLDDIAKTKQHSAVAQTQVGDLDKLNEDIMSLSSRTNKILLSSDESYNSLKVNLSELTNVVYHLEDRVKTLDNRETLSKVDEKLDKVNNLMISSVKSDKIFNETFMYLAEWVDSASESLDKIIYKVSEVDEVKQSVLDLKKSLPKKVDFEAILDKMTLQFDYQQQKIDSLEEKIEQLISVSTTKETVKADTKLSKKVDSIEKQLTKLNKGIEKLTSYVDEE